MYYFNPPNNDDDVFAGIWRGANKKVDEYGQIKRDGTGINGFKANATCTLVRTP